MRAQAGFSARIALTLALGMTGCKPRVTLDEVPILGGTDEQRAIVRDQLAAFETWVGPDRISLRSIRFTGQPDSRHGVYFSLENRISIDPEVELDQVAWIVRHELCHALDRQENLVHTLPELEGLVEALERDEIELFENKALKGARMKKGEVLAHLCEGGPAPSLLAQRSCPGDPPEFEAIGHWFVENVWTGEPDLRMGDGWVAEPADARHPIPFVPEGLFFLGGVDGASAHLFAYWAEPGNIQEERLWLDLQTGEPAEEVPYDPSGSYDLLPPEPLPVGLSAPPPSAALLPIQTVVQGERAAAVTYRPDFRSWKLAPRLVLLDEGVWHGVDHCPGEAATVFHTPDGLWVGWVEEQQARWAPLRPR